MKKKIALWGTGTMALAFYYSHKHQYDVVCFFDNDVSKQGSFIDGRPVYAGNAWGGGNREYHIQRRVDCDCIDMVGGYCKTVR